MPGAFDLGFRYFDPTAPKPDEDTLISGGLGKVEPTYTGEIRGTGRGDSRDPRANTFEGIVARQLYDTVDPVGIASAARDAGRAIGLGLKDGDLGELGSGAAQAVFLAPMFAGRLQAAGKIKAGERGSLEALKRAQEGWAAPGHDKRKIWDETGWADGTEFGPFRDGRTPEPKMWYGLADMDVADYRPGVSGGHLDGVVKGVGDLDIARPGLGSMPTTIKIDPRMSQNDATGGVGWNTQISSEPTDLYAYGRHDDDLRAILGHELQHTVQRPGKEIDFSFQEPRNAIPDTIAEKKWRAVGDVYDDARFDAEQALQTLRGGADSTTQWKKAQEMGAFGEAASMARERADNVPARAAYLNAPHEVEARTAAEIYGRSRPEIMRGVYPGSIDSFSRDAFWPHVAEGDPFNVKTAPAGQPYLVDHTDFKSAFFRNRR